MIPTILEEEIRQTILDYLETTFSLQDDRVWAALEAFLQDVDGGIFKGPYVQVRLPYRRAGEQEAQGLLDVLPPYPPYVHQVAAFARLTANHGHQPQPTIVTTGTGSGKTDCFLYPLLDHCRREAGKPGIKAIVLYPMNALAEDQAGKFAAEIWRDERLKGRVTAGMYVGGKGKFRTMGPRNVITEREVLRDHPPDILLTNYKMLDFLLLRPEDARLWRETSPESVRYLVLDELHTYDGAQGSDVACLIRRLRSRLGASPYGMCCVGTSATLAGDQAAAVTELVEFASKIFGIPFHRDAVVTETRLELSEYLGEDDDSSEIPSDLEGMSPRREDTLESYVARQGALWLGTDGFDPVELARRLRRHGFLRGLLLNLGGAIAAWEDVVERTAKADPDFAALGPEARDRVLRSFLAVVSQARSRREPSEQLEPFLQLQVQLWIREMSRMVREVATEPRFFWRENVPLKDERKGLPAIYCRECGASGWLGARWRHDTRVLDDLGTIYQQYFDRGKNVVYLFPGERRGEIFKEYLCPGCLVLDDQETCPRCKRPGVPVLSSAVHTAGKSPKDLQHCPFCESDFSLSLAASQAASLSAVAISHLYQTRFNVDKKLIAFTDSVQDASHRASFFGARTYRFNLRTAIQTVLEAEPTGRIGLEALTGRILEFWQARWTPQELAAAFVPDDLRDLPEYRDFLESGATKDKLPKKLAGILSGRLSWEVVMEYGFSARVGRTLDKVACSTAFLDEGLLAKTLDRLGRRLREEFAPLHDVADGRFRHFVVGLLTRTRVRGGIFHPFLEKYAQGGGNWYDLSRNRQPYVSPFGSHSRLPRFLSLQPSETVFDSCIASKSAATWYLDWAQRCLSPALDPGTANDLYRSTIEILESGGLLERVGKKSDGPYAIPQAALVVTRHAARLLSPEDGHRQTVPESEVAAWEGMPSLAYRGGGRYLLEAGREQSYYREVYRSGQVKRIFTHEHSGLLDRETREDVEDLFKTGKQADAPNLLTCTPTLELGIDIGDLSSAMLCSIPPTPTNYLQRIGRAGRTTGNAMIVALANVRPHDLYFYENPFEMVAGLVSPPGCYLDAPEMLKRQYVAFVMDTWCRDGSDSRPLPNKVMHLLASNRRDEFPQTFLRYARENAAALFERFRELFGSYVSEEGWARLRDHAVTDAMAVQFNECLRRTEAQVEDLRRRRDLLKDRRDRIQGDPEKHDDPEAQVEDLEREMHTLGQLLRGIQEKYPLNLFTDEGLLPNYAFPESGVTLRSVIFGLEGRPASGGGSGATWSEAHEYLRAASEAIRDLAPLNTFYAEARKVVVDQVETGGRNNSKVESWRLCDACSHLELEAEGSTPVSCPSCGSTAWKDVGRRHELLRLSNVSSRTSHQASQTGDESDERERRRYQVRDFIDVVPGNWGGGFADAEGTFGFEFLRQVTLRELNFGEQNARRRDFVVAGDRVPEDGFWVCKDCGVVRDPDAAKEPQHRFWCHYNQGNRKPEWHRLFLYRELKSEAIRILLPVSTFEVTRKLATFQACLELGLRRKFRGNPEHLIIRYQQEPGTGGDRTPRQFLVLYDSVPGGTGYLKEFARKPEAFRDVLEQASRTLKSCSCRRKGNEDGCYRCVFAYRRQYQLESISRELGIELLEGILRNWHRLSPVQTLSHVEVSEGLIESELEARFRDALGKYLSGQGLPWKKVLLQGKACYELEISGRTWVLEPQVPLGAPDNVAVACQPDFVLRPTKDESGVLPVAIFLDGFAFHVSPEKPRSPLEDDVAKRTAIMRSGRFLVWSICWDDVAEFEVDPSKPGASLLADFLTQPPVLRAALRKADCRLSADLPTRSPIGLLLQYLDQPAIRDWRAAAAAVALATMVPLDGFADPASVASVERAILEAARPAGADLSLTRAVDQGDPNARLARVRTSADWAFLASATKAAADRLDADCLKAFLRLEDGVERRASVGFKLEWRKCLTACNLLQFLPGFRWVTSEGVRRGGAPEAAAAPAGAGAPALGGAPAAPAMSGVLAGLAAAYQQALELADPAVSGLLRALAETGIPAPTVGFELADAEGRTCAEAELVWPAKKVAVILPRADEAARAFEVQGWTVFAAAHVAADPGKLVEVLRE